jgi:hypothetical protein
LRCRGQLCRKCHARTLNPAQTNPDRAEPLGNRAPHRYTVQKHSAAF